MRKFLITGSFTINPYRYDSSRQIRSYFFFIAQTLTHKLNVSTWEQNKCWVLTQISTSNKWL